MQDAIARAKAIAARLSASVQGTHLTLNSADSVIANEGQAMKRKQEFDHVSFFLEICSSSSIQDSRPRVAANGRRIFVILHV